MNLNFERRIADGYTSKSQIARVLTEQWVGNNIYCPSCGNENLKTFANNSPVADYYCSYCLEEFELKSKKDSFSKKIADGAFTTMIQRITSANNPSFFFLNYSNKDLAVKNFLVIPKYFFVESVIEKRRPLAPTAKRAGWVGCNILLQNIPESGKIYYIKGGTVVDQQEVVNIWKRTSFLLNHSNESRGWTIEILKVLEKIPGKMFNLKSIYAFERELQYKFPNNNFVKDKIRQQLQVLRDKGLIEFNGRGQYSKI